MPSPFCIYRGINFCGYKIQKYISSNIEKVRKKQMKYLYMNEQGAADTVLSISKILAGITAKSECENYLYAAV